MRPEVEDNHCRSADVSTAYSHDLQNTPQLEKLKRSGTASASLFTLPHALLHRLDKRSRRGREALEAPHRPRDLHDETSLRVSHGQATVI